MINRFLQWLLSYLLVACVALIFVNGIAAQGRSSRKHRVRVRPAAQSAANSSTTTAPAQIEIVGKRIKFADGSIIEADEVWKQGDEYWYRTGKVAQRVSREVRSVDPIRVEPEKQPEKGPVAATPADTTKSPAQDAYWILLKGGARMKVDEVNETDAGAWYRRGNFSMFLERDRIERIERESALAAAEGAGWKQRDWTSGAPAIDGLIRSNGARFGLDPYLIFCVMEHESHFHTRAVSPKGARGLMQLMPGTAARFGVRRPFDPAQNIFGGTQYLKELLGMFGGRLDLALASYNAGEGAVIKYGRNVPPYRETREYVRRVTQRYGGGSDKPEKTSTSPQ
jgi:soluble lytic murein transglycosylase-like protein